MTALSIVAPTERQCTKCDVTKPLSEFYKDQKGRNNKSLQCKKCRRNAVDSYYLTLSEAEKKQRRAPYVNGDYCRSANYKKLYGLTLEDVKRMHRDQLGCCANRGCGRELDVDIRGVHKNKAVVDHCHTTGKVRGLLCYRCNTTLGLLEDKNVMLGFAEYLHKYGDGKKLI